MEVATLLWNDICIRNSYAPMMQHSMIPICYDCELLHHEWVKSSLARRGRISADEVEQWNMWSKLRAWAVEYVYSVRNGSASELAR